MIQSSDLYAFTDLYANNEYGRVYVADCVFHDAELDAGSNDFVDVLESVFLGGGMSIAGETWLNVRDNLLSDGAYIWARAADDGGYVKNNTVTGADVGIDVGGGFEEDIDIVGNVVSGCGTGILAGSAVVTDSRIWNCDQGLVLNDDAGAERNVIYDCGDGIVVEGVLNWSWFSIANNTVVDCSGTGILYEATDVANLGDLKSNIVVGSMVGVGAAAGMDPAQTACNDVWNNPGENWFGIPNPTGTNGNISEDPMFCGANGYYELQEGSPCSPGSPPNPECDLIGALPVACTPAAVTPAAGVGGLRLGPAVPNPFGSETRLAYEIPAGMGNRRLLLSVYDAAGRRVRTLLSGAPASGTFQIGWDGKDPDGKMLPNGVYFLRAQWNGKQTSRSIVFVR